MPNITLKNLNKFVLEFLSENTSTEVEKNWMDNSVQTKVKNLLNKKPLCKDPNAPKRSKSAYLYFCTKYRAEVTNELGVDAKVTEVTRVLGLKWKKLKEDKTKLKEFESFEKMAKDDKERYNNELLEYKPTEEFVSKVKSKVSGPKRTKSAYLYFCEENRKQVCLDLDGAKVTAITKELGLRWSKAKANNNVSKYVALAEEDKTRYSNEKKNTTEETKNTTEETKNTTEETKNTTEETKKETKHLNAYQNFCAENRAKVKEEFPNEKPAAITKRLSVQWKNMNKEEQKKF
jgi:hypothetical protein